MSKHLFCLTRGSIYAVKPRKGSNQQDTAPLAALCFITTVGSLAARLSCKEKDVTFPRYQTVHLQSQGVSSTKLILKEAQIYLVK